MTELYRLQNVSDSFRFVVFESKQDAIACINSISFGVGEKPSLESRREFYTKDLPNLIISILDQSVYHDNLVFRVITQYFHGWIFVNEFSFKRVFRKMTENGNE